MSSTEPSAAGQLAPLLILLVWTLILGFVARALAKDKGRNVTRWTILGFIPGVNLICMWFFVGAVNLRAERKIDALLIAQGQDPQKFAHHE